MEMFYTSGRRYRLRRFAVLRSIPLRSAPNSCAVVSRWWWLPAKALEAYEAQLLMAAGDVSRVRGGADVAAGEHTEGAGSLGGWRR